MSNWQIKTLSRIGTFSKGAGISKDSVLAEGLNAVRYGELYTDYNVFVKKIRSHISEKTASEATIIHKGDILFAGSGETIDDIGKSAVYTLDESGYAGGDIIIFRPDDINEPLFLAQVLNSNIARRELRRLGQGQSIVHIYKSELEKLKLCLPEKPEQQRIVSVLGIWDEYLELLDKKIELKRRIYEGLTRQLLTCKKRLPQFTEDWENSTIGELSTVVKSLKTEGGDKSYLEIGDIDIKTKTYNITSKTKVAVNGANFVKRGTLLISTVRPTRGAVVIVKQDMYVSMAFCKLTIKNNFLLYIASTKRFLDYLGSVSSGGTYPTCSVNDILNYDFKCPISEVERDEISTILDVSRLEILNILDLKKIINTQKKYLLNNLITGKIITPENLSMKGVN